MPITNFIYAVGTPGAEQKSIVYSTDGTTWQGITTDPFSATGSCADIATDGSTVIVAGGWDGAGTGHNVFYSTDGLSFQSVTFSGGDDGKLFAGGRCRKIHYANGKFVACGVGGITSKYSMAYSIDGITWSTPATDPFNPDHVVTNSAGATNVYFADNLWIAVGAPKDTSGSGVASSSDGYNWTMRYLNESTTNPLGAIGYNVYYGGGKWVIAGDGGFSDFSIAFSANGSDWTRVVETQGMTMPTASLPSRLYYGSVGEGSNMWMYVSSKGDPVTNTILQSADGETWSLIATPSATADPFGFNGDAGVSIYYANGYWVETGGGVITKAITWSSDGATWTMPSEDLNDPFFVDSIYYPSKAITYNAHYSKWVISSASGPNQLAIADTYEGPWTKLSTFTGSVFDNIVNLTFTTIDPGPPAPCFLESSTILTDDGYIPIENIKPGTLVKTFQEGFKRVQYIGFSTIHNTESTDRIQRRLYILRKEKYPELTEDLILTGDHSILVDKFTDVQRELIRKTVGRIFMTGKKARLMSFANEKAEPWTKEGKFKVWHLALESTEDNTNYGIYANGGLLVESAAIKALKDRQGMTLM